MKRQQQQDSIDPSSRIDSDLFKDPLKQRESEHEQEWKFRQVWVIWMIWILNCIFAFWEREVFMPFQNIDPNRTWSIKIDFPFGKVYIQIGLRYLLNYYR